MQPAHLLYAIALSLPLILSACDRKDAENVVPQSASSSNVETTEPALASAGEAITNPSSASANQTPNEIPSTTAAGHTPPPLTDAERNFILQTSQNSNYEVGLAGIANEKVDRSDIKQFASMLVDDHVRAGTQLRELAVAHKIDLPAELDRTKQNEIQEFSKLPQRTIAKRFVQQVGVDAHRKTIQQFEKMQADAKDPQLKAWINSTLPVLKHHFEDAQKLASKT